MKNTRYAGFILFLALFAAAAAFSAGRKSSTEAYLQQLHSRGRERVIILFEGPPDKAVVEKYDLRIPYGRRRADVPKALALFIRHRDTNQIVIVDETGVVEAVRETKGLREAFEEEALGGPVRAY